MKKLTNKKTTSAYAMLSVSLIMMSSCNGVLSELSGKKGAAASAASMNNGSGGPGSLGSGSGSAGSGSSGGSGGTPAAQTPVAGTGMGPLTQPTAFAVIQRITNAMPGVNPSTGNFAKMIAQVQGNLAQSPDPMVNGNMDQNQLLAYAACSDLTTVPKGGTSLMQTNYAVTPSATVPSATVQASIVNAGITILNQYTAGMAAAGASSASAAVNSTLTSLVAGVAATPAGTAAAPTNTTTIAFMTACIAANTAGLLLGF